MWHEIFIYGYDIEEDKVYFAANILNGKYIKTECSFEEIEKAYWNIESAHNFFHNLHLFGLKECIELSFDMEQVISSIKKYLYSIKSVDVSFNEKCIFGFDAANLIVESAEKRLINNDNSIDIIPFQLLWEHKLLMELRLKYMLDNGYFVGGETFVDGYKLLKEKYFVIRNLVLKYILTKNKEILMRIIEALNKELMFEKVLLSKLLEKIGVVAETEQNLP
jgi:hypothetical protein